MAWWRATRAAAAIEAQKRHCRIVYISVSAPSPLHPYHAPLVFLHALIYILPTDEIIANGRKR